MLPRPAASCLPCPALLFSQRFLGSRDLERPPAGPAAPCVAFQKLSAWQETTKELSSLGKTLSPLLWLLGAAFSLFLHGHRDGAPVGTTVPRPSCSGTVAAVAQQGSRGFPLGGPTGHSSHSGSPPTRPPKPRGPRTVPSPLESSLRLLFSFLSPATPELEKPWNTQVACLLLHDRHEPWGSAGGRARLRENSRRLFLPAGGPPL